MPPLPKITALSANHPNAAAATVAQLLAGGLVAIAARLGLHLSTVYALLIVGAAGPVRLYVGRRGVVGAAREAWATFLHGSGSAS
jgi:hypothetical protein